MGSALSGIMRASGSVLVPTSISIFCIALIEVPVAWWLSHRIGPQRHLDRLSGGLHARC